MKTSRSDSEASAPSLTSPPPSKRMRLSSARESPVTPARLEIAEILVVGACRAPRSQSMSKRASSRRRAPPPEASSTTRESSSSSSCSSSSSEALDALAEEASSSSSSSMSLSSSESLAAASSSATDPVKESEESSIVEASSSSSCSSSLTAGSPTPQGSRNVSSAPPVSLPSLAETSSPSNITSDVERMVPSEKSAKPAERMKCTCKKSRCLKLYCQCFASSQGCKDCYCSNCLNNPENVQAVTKAREEIKTKNPLAFGSKIKKETHLVGCKCRRSFCQKMYCECFQAGVRCGSHCKCEGCKNQG